MKKHGMMLCVSMAALLFSSVAMAFSGSYSPGNGINGTVHDLSHATNGLNNYVANPSDSLNRICIFCHAPHNTMRLATSLGGSAGGSGPQAPDAFDYLPLWNHELTGNYASYSMYNNGPGAPQVGSRASQAMQSGMKPGSTSLLCLSCHDGSVAVNQYGNVNQLARSQSGGGPVIDDIYTIGKNNNLQNHHPIGFSYDDARSGDPELRDPESTVLTNAPSMGVTTIRDHLYGTDGRVECGSCHSVHNKGNTGETLLWRSDTNSNLCLTCHDKGTYTAP